MKKIILLFSFIFFSSVSSLFCGFSPYDLYYLGPKGLALGGAYTTLADDPSAVFWNPAGLSQQQSASVSLLFDVQFMMNNWRDPVSPQFNVIWGVPNMGTFVQPTKGPGRLTWAFTVGAPVQRKIGSRFYVLQTSPSIAFRPYKYLLLGLNIGGLYTYQFNAGWGWNVDAGLIWLPTDFLRIGLVYHSPFKVTWKGLEITQKFPMRMQGGVMFRFTPRFLMALELEYQDWMRIYYSEKGVDLTPDIKTGLFYNVLPHLGFIYIDKRTGAHMRFGLLNRSFIDEPADNKPQFNLTLGLGARALKIIEVEIALADSYLISLIDRDALAVEILQIMVTYRFGGEEWEVR